MERLVKRGMKDVEDEEEEEQKGEDQGHGPDWDPFGDEAEV